MLLTKGLSPMKNSAFLIKEHHKPLAQKAVHIWVFDTERLAVYDTVYLSLEEQERARHFGAQRAKAFITARTFLRLTLSHYLERPPTEIQIVLSESGKPAVAEGSLSFSLSHCHHFIAIAVGKETPLGVDIERENLARPIQALISRVGCTKEQTWALKKPAQGFYQLWTAKEAASKALDQGVFASLKTLEMAELESPCWKVLAQGQDTNLAIVHLDCAKSFQVALCARVEHCQSVEIMRCL